MKIFLRYVGDPGFQSGVAEDLGVYQMTVSKVIADTATKIIEKAPLWIKFPSTKEELKQQKPTAGVVQIISMCSRGFRLYTYSNQETLGPWR
jgi:hypothetical protein